MAWGVVFNQTFKVPTKVKDNWFFVCQNLLYLTLSQLQKCSKPKKELSKVKFTTQNKAPRYTNADFCHVKTRVGTSSRVPIGTSPTARSSVRTCQTLCNTAPSTWTIFDMQLRCAPTIKAVCDKFSTKSCSEFRSGEWSVVTSAVEAFASLTSGHTELGVHNHVFKQKCVD